MTMKYNELLEKYKILEEENRIFKEFGAWLDVTTISASTAAPSRHLKSACWTARGSPAVSPLRN
ncbi:MAG: hypothetical protein DDT32_00927 [Syntrophomonadaceae bacterium]|nr:hypothetical protein [Bacillota bacterium]MBT9147175.1 hypothetical protein [Bacillota bacterium]